MYIQNIKKLYPVLFLLFAECSNNIASKISGLAKQVDSNTTVATYNISDSILHSIRLRSDLLLGYFTYGAPPGKRQPLLLVRFTNGGKSWGYSIMSKHRVVYSSNDYVVDSFPITKNDRDSILATFKRNEGWTLKRSEEEDARQACPYVKGGKECNILDGGTEVLLIATKTHLQYSYFYEPAYLEACCPGNRYRQRFLAITAPIENFFKKQKPIVVQP